MWAYDFIYNNLCYEFSASSSSQVYVVGCYATGAITIPSTVTYYLNGNSNQAMSCQVIGIGNSAFDGASITSVSMPSSVTSIGSYAFADCRSLTSISFSNNTISIDDYAFSGCNNLKTITIPGSVKSLGRAAFYNCSNLETVNVSNNLETVGWFAFGETKWFGNQPDGLVYVGKVAYRYKGTMPNNTTIELEEGTLSIAYGAFAECKGLTSIVIPSSVKSIGNIAFSGCNLASVTMKSTTPIEITSSAFYNQVHTKATLYVPRGSKSAYESAEIWKNFKNIVETTLVSPIIEFADANVKALCVTNWDTNGDSELSEEEAAAVTDLGEVFQNNTQITSFDELRYFTSLTSIGNYAFLRCGGLTSITIPNSVTSIGYSAFEKCSGLTLLTIPNSVTSIGYHAFFDCNNLTSANLPNSVTSIGEGAFICCYGLDSPIYNAHYFARMPYSHSGSYMIPDGITNICDYAFSGCSGLTSVSIPNSVTSIAGSAFTNCSGLTSIVSEIEDPFIFGRNAFNNIASNCVLTVPYEKKNAYIAKGWTEDVFKGGIVEAPAPSPNITFADANVKALCVENWDTNGDGELDQEEAAAVTSLGTIFKGNTTITTFEEFSYFIGATSISANEFRGCNRLASIIIPNNVISIGNDAFRECSSLTSISIPDGVTSISSQTFYLCNELTSINLPNGITSIGGGAFRDCKKMSAINLPQSITSIGKSAFNGCISLKTLTIPIGINRIENNTFLGCSNLTSITIPSGITYVGNSSFSGCSSLASVVSEIEEPFAFGSGAFSEISSSCTLTIPAGTKDAYIANGWTEDVFKGGIVEKPDTRTVQTISLTSLPSMTYGATNYALPTQTTQGLTLTWASSNTAVATISGNILTVKGAGTAAITASQAGNEEYKPFSKEFTLTVAKAPLTITVNDATKNVGDVNPAFTASYEGFVGDDDASVLTAQPTFTTEADENSPVGTYAIVVSGAEAANYEINYVNGTLTVVDEWSMSNTISLTDTQVLRGRQVVLPVSMNNTEDITALQFDLTLPAGVSIAVNSKGKYIVAKTERCADHTLSTSKPGEENVYKVLLYSTEVESITGNEGAVIHVTIEAAEDMEAGDYEVKLSNINLTTTAEKKITPADVTCVLTVRNSIPGDANGDGEIDVTDIVGIANKILGRASDSFVAAAADVNGDGEVDVTDIVAVANIILRGGKANSAKVREAFQMLDPQ